MSQLGAASRPFSFSSLQLQAASEAVLTKEFIEKIEASSDTKDCRYTAAEERQLVHKIDGQLIEPGQCMTTMATLNISQTPQLVTLNIFINF